MICRKNPTIKEFYHILASKAYKLPRKLKLVTKTGIKTKHEYLLLI